MCVGVVKEERELKLISLIPHILNMQDSGPGGGKKEENMLQQKRKRKQHLSVLSPFSQLRLLNIQV